MDKEEKVKKILLIASSVLIVPLVYMGISSAYHLDKIKAGESVSISKGSQSYTLENMKEVMNSELDGYSDEEKATIEIEAEEELERQFLENNKEKIKEAQKLLEKRLAQEETQREQVKKDEKLMELSSIKRELPEGNSSSSLASKALNRALTQIGKPYVWGAVGPDTYDCSGLVLWAYNQEGYFAMTRTTRTQWRQGEEIKREDVERGDLIYFLNNPLKSPVDHVGIYLGEGMMLHAPRPGKFVEITKVPWSNMVTIRRHY